MHRPLATLIAVALTVAACTPASSDPTSTTALTSSTSGVTTTTESTEPIAGQVRIGVDSPILTLNPLSDELFGANRLVGQAVWATVYTIEPETWNRVPNVVSSLPSQTPGAIEIAEDGSMTVRYEVVKGATWSDGTPITGDDIAFTAEAMASVASGDSASVMSAVIATDAVDRLAWITFSSASLAFEDALRVILPAHAISGATDLRTDDGMHWPSGGPFMVSAEQTGRDLVLERNPHYWKSDDQGTQLPYLDGVTVISPEEPGGEVDLFADGFVDIIVPSQSPDVLDRLEAFAAAGADVQQVPTPIVEHLTFQFAGGRDLVNDQSNNDLLDFRMAVAHSIDRPGLLELTGVPWISEAPGMLVPIGASAWQTYDFDPARGKSLVEDMHGEAVTGVPPVSVLSTTGNGDARIAIGDALVEAFGDVGIDLSTSYLDSLIFFGETIGTGAFDIGMWAWVSDGGYGNQLSLLELFDPASEAADANFGNWGFGVSAGTATETFSELVAAARTTTDAAAFSEIIARAEELLAENLPMIPLFMRSSTAAVRSEAVSGVVHNGSVSEITWNVETWRIPNG
jgi:peptide/nickel transport system substrate-binding protein